MEPLISIIIPIYNKEQYIKACFDSVLNQSYKNLEIICIDDGSTDKSISIVKQYMDIDKRISLYTTNHLGPSNARNVGLEKCKGDYIHFVDADDLVKPNIYNVLVSYINKYNSIDLVYFYFYNFTKEDENLYKVNKNTIDFSESEEFKELSLLKDSDYLVFKCGDGANLANKLFNRHIIKSENIIFNADLPFYEDSDFVFKYIVKCKKFIALPYDFYCYRHNVIGSQVNTKENEKGVYETIFKVYYTSLDGYKKISEECLLSYMKSLLNLMFGSYRAIHDLNIRLSNNDLLSKFINDNIKDATFKKALSFFETDTKLLRYNIDSITYNVNYKSEYEVYKKMYLREKEHYDKIRSSITYKVGKIILFPYTFYRTKIKKNK